MKTRIPERIAIFLPLSHDRSFIVALVVPSKIHLESMAGTTSSNGAPVRSLDEEGLGGVPGV